MQSKEEDWPEQDEASNAVPAIEISPETSPVSVDSADSVDDFASAISEEDDRRATARVTFQQRSTSASTPKDINDVNKTSSASKYERRTRGNGTFYWAMTESTKAKQLLGRGVNKLTTMLAMRNTPPRATFVPS